MEAAADISKSFFILIFLLLSLIGIIVLQIFLSKKQNRWLGLILPTLSLFISILVILGIASFTSYRTEETLTENGEIVSRIVDSSANLTDISVAIFPVIYAFILCNIPTVILLGIYLVCREKAKKNKEIEKMNIQDLV